MDSIGFIDVIWGYAKAIFDFGYMLAVFFICLYLFRFSPWSTDFEDGKKKQKWTLYIGIVLGVIFVSLKFAMIGFTQEIWVYHVNLIISFCTITSIYDYLASYLIKKLELLNKKEENHE